MSEQHKPGKILIADDDDFLISMYTSKFKAKGVDTLHAKTGQEALEKLRNEADSIDSILLDIIMPDMNGLDTLETIKSEGLDKNKSIVMLTNQGNASDIDRAKGMGVQGYIVKATSIPSEVVDQVLDIHDQFKQGQD